MSDVTRARFEEVLGERDEARALATQLADALRGLLERAEYRSPATDAARAALAVFDAKEKT